MLFQLIFLTGIITSSYGFKYYSPSGSISEDSTCLVQMPILCPPGSALLGFQMESDPSDTNKLRWGYDCYENDAIDLKGEKVLFTEWNETDHKKIIYIDRHEIKCEDGYVLRGFQMERLKSDNIRFRYNCYPLKSVDCQSGYAVSTGWKQIGETPSGLKNLHIKSFCDNCPLKGFKVKIDYRESFEPKDWFGNYYYDWCIVRDDL